MTTRRLALVALLVLAPAPRAWAASAVDYRRPEVQRAIAELARGAILARLAGRPFALPAVPAALEAPCGVFVTLSTRGVTRGCWGTVEPVNGSAAREIAVNAAKALRHDTRQRPITASELPALVAHVSLVGPLRPAFDAHALQPRRLGLLVAGHGKGGVLLPGEAATARWQIETCRRKAGLGARERASMYTFETTVVGPIAIAPGSALK